MTTVEFAVQLKSDCCVSQVEKSLKSLEGVESVQVLRDIESVVVKSTLPSSVIQKQIESTGRRAIVTGYGGGDNSLAAVAMIGGTSGFSANDKVVGVVRFVDSSDHCVVDGVIDGLSPGNHGLHVHELGDISQGCDSIGPHFDLSSNVHGGLDTENQHTGDLGNVRAGDDGRAVFRLESTLLRVGDIIGRSLCVTEHEDDLGKGSSARSPLDGNCGIRLACGIISRSSGLFENNKKICACDGVTIWDERDKPLAGPGRSNL